VLTLNSVARLLRTFLPLLQRRPRFEQTWRNLLRFCELSLTSSARSQEVALASAIGALAAIGALHQLLLSSVATRSLLPRPPRRRSRRRPRRSPR